MLMSIRKLNLERERREAGWVYGVFALYIQTKESLHIKGEFFP